MCVKPMNARHAKCSFHITLQLSCTLYREVAQDNAQDIFSRDYARWHGADRPGRRPPRHRRAPEAEAGATAVLRQPSATGSTSGTTGSGATGDVVVITRVNGNLRATPSVNADILTVIPFNTTLTVTGRNETNNWVRVTFDNQTGWISSGVLFFQSGNIDNVTALDASGNPVPVTSQPVPETTPSP